MENESSRCGLFSGWGSFFSIFLFFFIFYFFIFHFFIFHFFIFLFFHFFIFYFFIFLFFHFFIFIFFDDVITHPTHPSLFLSCLPQPTPPLFFFLLPCRRFPNPCRRFPTIFRRSSPPIRSQDICDVIFGKYGRKGPMRQTNEILELFLDPMSSLFRPTIFNNQSEATIFRRFFRRCSPPIRSQEIHDVIFGKYGRKGPTVLLTKYVTFSHF